MSVCLFCQIVSGTIPADIVARSASFLAFRDIAPKAPVHVLVIPTHHVTSVAAVGDLTEAERADMLAFIAQVADEQGLTKTGYRVVTNHGPDGRQSVFHLHWHLMGGTTLSESM